MSYQYYPTGERTAALMWHKFQRPIRHLCDPSAGKGHLIRYAQNGFEGLADAEIPWMEPAVDEPELQPSWRAKLRQCSRQKFQTLREISVVELDIEHHASLKEIGAKIIAYDFLDVSSIATVSHIIMNPPFMEGAKHVLHAWDVAYDAELVAIINAETIKNPFSEERKRLVRLIEAHGTVEFLKDQFTDDVERTTQVEIALIYLEKVPGKYLDMESLLGGLTRGGAKAGAEIDPQTCSALALPSNFIQDTCFRFDQAVQAARQASESIAVADRLLGAIGLTLEEMQARGVGTDFRESATSIRQAANAEFKTRYDDIKKRSWGQILRSSLLTDRLSNQARKKIESSASTIYDLEFTAANIHGFLAGVIASMGDIYQTMIVDLFDSIIERSSDNVVFYRSWKSNQKHRIGMRIRKSRFIIPRFRMSYGERLEYECAQFLSDIDKVFGFLHGVTGPYDGLMQGFSKPGAASGARIETRFFDFRFYSGAGTIHFFPKNEEVVAKINRFVGALRNWIPGDMNEANNDFRKQYEEGEGLNKQYNAKRKKSARSFGRNCPSYQLLQSVKDEECDDDQLAQLDAAIAEAHADIGLVCGPALAGPVSPVLRLAA